MNLKELRQSKGISQVDISIHLGMSLDNYRNYERGRYNEMCSELEKAISDLLGIKFSYEEHKQQQVKTIEGQQLTESEVRRKFGVTYQTIYNWRKRGIPCEIVNGEYLYNLQQVKEWVSANGRITM